MKSFYEELLQQYNVRKEIIEVGTRALVNTKIAEIQKCNNLKKISALVEDSRLITEQGDALIKECDCQIDYYKLKIEEDNGNE